ncbi:MAG: hypothetical protein U5R31_00105 [Acidimicrobiia bacterium]|nr:hypothetical protein [Acidimicrobiia bacterium]
MGTPDETTDLHEWVSFDDPDGHTWNFDLTFLTSNYECIWGNGCPGVLDEPAPELEHGCCSFGAHFTEKADRKRVNKLAEKLGDDEWQFKAEAADRGGPIYKNEDGDWVTRVHDGACIFHNRPGFEGGSGCALHGAALRRGERPLDWKPEVCWQLPLRYEEQLDDNEHLTITLREWKRRDWGEGGEEFHWWCTDSDEAFIGREPVYRAMRDEIVELIGEAPYEALVRHIERRQETLLPHPALKNPARSADS